MSLPRKVVVKSSQVMCRLRGHRLRLWIRLWGGVAERGLMVERGVVLRHPPGAGWSIKSNVYIGRGAILDVWPGARLSIDRRVKIMHYVVLGVRECVVIGADSQISEFSTVRDADHQIDADLVISQAPMVSSPISIGTNVWVARGCAVLRGSSIGNGVVVAANSVVRGVFADNSLIAGTPARVKRSRSRSDEIGEVQ